MIKILIVDDEKIKRMTLKEDLEEAGYDASISSSGQDALELLRKEPFDVVVTDFKMQQMDGIELLKMTKAYYPDTHVIMMTAYGTVETAVESMKLGAYDYITKPYDFDELLVTINNAADHKSLLVKNTVLTDIVNKKLPHNIVGDSPQLQRIINLASKAAMSDSNILIEGETGTGKELFAEYIHKHSTRADKPFVVINCASLPDQLIESELFGHERGAFTDAKNTKQGLVEIANGGTLFLDEIGEMSLSLQPLPLQPTPAFPSISMRLRRYLWP